MERVFISMPMNGFSVEDLHNRMTLAENEVMRMYEGEVKICHNLTTLPPCDSVNNERLYYLGNAIIKMANCDAVYFYGDWTKANGCLVEFEVANRYGLKCYFSK